MLPGTTTLCCRSSQAWRGPMAATVLEPERSRMTNSATYGRALDKAAVPACYPAFIRFLLLTATRPGEASGLHKIELDSDVVWTIPAERYKTKHDHVVPLSTEARALIGPRAELPGLPSPRLTARRPSAASRKPRPNLIRRSPNFASGKAAMPCHASPCMTLEGRREAS